MDSDIKIGSKAVWNSAKGYSKRNELVKVIAVSKQHGKYQIVSDSDPGESKKGFVYWVPFDELEPAVKRQSNPSLSTEVKKGLSLYRRFTGHDDRTGMKLTIPDMPKSVVFIGMCDGVMYTTVRDGKTEHYKHEFAEADRPYLATSPDGKQLFLLKGRYKFGKRGIVDKSDKTFNPRD